MKIICQWLQSVGHALRGGGTLLRTQPNARIHFVATLAVLIAGMFWEISAVEWALVMLAFGLVWMAEAFNTAVEFLADEVSLEWRERIKRAKDVSAFAVLAAATVAAGVTIAVFGQRLHALVFK